MISIMKNDGKGHMMDLKQLQTLVAVVEENGFTSAAKRLNYGQSTVTLHIKAIEAHYGEPLFDRIGKKIYLTPLGNEVYKEALILLQAYKRLEDLNQQSNHAVLRIGVYESLLHYRIQNLISSFKVNHPETDLVIRHGTCNELRELVRTGQLDLAFQIEPQREFSDLVTTLLVEEHFSLIFPRGMDETMMGDRHYTVYLTEKECTYRRAFENYLDLKGILKHQTMETGSVEVIKQYVSCGLGYSFVPSVTVRDPQNLEKLEIQPVSFEDKLYTQILYHKDKSLTPAMLAFLKALEQEAETWR